MSEPTRILIVEDLPTDAELAQREIKGVLEACAFQRVDTPAAYLAALETFQPDLIISDFSMPRFNGLTVLNLALKHVPLTPVIILTGSINEDTAVECMKAGATNYVIKEHLKRLGAVVIHALEEKRSRLERQRAEEALRESEEKYRVLFETMTQGVVYQAANGQITAANAAAERILGLPLDQMQGRTSQDPRWRAIHEDGTNFPSETHPSMVALQTGVVVRNVVMGIFNPAREEYRWINIQAVPQFRPGEKTPYQVYTLFDDITEQKLAEEARVKLEEQLRQNQKMESIGRLAGGVAHDFNNLLTVIRGYSEFMQKRMLPNDPHVADLEQIRQASERAASLTRQLLIFSRKQILAPIALNLNTLLTDLHKLLGRLIGEDITLSLNLRPGLWTITADPGQIEQVIMNLVVNARDAMPTGGLLTIETQNIHLDQNFIQTHPAAPLGLCVLLTVTDTGHGMDKSTLTRIFEPFFTTKESGQGTGLGLATVFGIVKQSGGDIVVYSEPGQGTTFRIYIPANKTSVRDLIEPPLQSASAAGNETILLVEDEEQVRTLVRNVLQDEGYTVLETHLGSEALLLAQQHQNSIDLLMTDVVMPHMSGRVLAEQLKVMLPDLKVLFMSGYTDDAVVRHGLLMAEVEFLSKPFSPIALLAKVREVIDK